MNVLLVSVSLVCSVGLKSLTLIGSAIAEVLFIIYNPTALNAEAVEDEQ